ncbi:remorin 1.4-like isoform X2 [Magnolia sinica]|uniref:remorin 1.4-like isoform X2 n=1 Tax=Magnolia sinica TaxID=86752 RepID=UPI0026597E4E|nr:remorin 1.4-like isoform X2 [Magnolia sinica]
MESLIKQIRVRFLGQDSQEDPSRRRVPPQKSQSFKPEKKRAQNWFVRQFSSRMSRDSSISDGEFETIVAATAFAITTLEETDSLNKKRSSDISISKMKSRKDDTLAGPSKASSIPTRSTEVATKKPELFDGKSLEKSATGNQKLQEKATGTVPSIKKTTTFSLDNKGEPESSKDKTGRPTSNDGKGNEYSSANGKTETQADAWEKSQMAKIKKRFQKQWSTIQSWEDEKKSKAKRRLDRKESVLDLRRARATQAYQLEIQRINKIAEGARSIAEESKRNDESKTREKARKYKSTGQLPVTCFCFQ